MASFSYRAIDGAGQIMSGKSDATNAVDLELRLRRIGLDLITFESIKKSALIRSSKVSRKEFFDKGALARIEEDTDGDGRVDKWETYTDGSLSVLALDTQGRGTPDRRLVYRPDGSLDHIEADPTGSGTFTPLKL